MDTRGRESERLTKKIKQFLARDSVKYVERCSTGRKTALGFSKAEDRQCQKIGCICFIDPDDMEFVDTMKKRAQKDGVACGIRHACKVPQLWHGETCGENKSITCRSKYVCIVEAHESTRKRTAKTQHKYHEDHTAGKGFIR